MKTKAVRLYGEKDLRLEEFDLPDIKEDEILAHVMVDSLCMSSYKALNLGKNHKRVPEDVAENPVIIGHEFCGDIIEVGAKWKNQYTAGDRFTVQPALGEHTLDAAGYSFRYFGGDATYVIIPAIYMENNCIIPYNGDAYFKGALSEPYSCVAGTFHAHYHTKFGSYEHLMGIKEGGNMIMMGAAGPMGTAAIDYILHCERKPGRLIVTDIDDRRLERIASFLTVEDAEQHNVELIYLNTGKLDNVKSELLSYTANKGFDDILVFAPVKPVVELADSILATNGCLNFFAGPADPNFKAEFNFFNAHYNATHITATNAGNTDDIREVILMAEKEYINPSILITHIGGLNAVAETTLNLPKIPGGKKLIYTNIDFPLTAISDFEQKGQSDTLFAELDKICKKHNGLWSAEAEILLLKRAMKIG
jgi:L-sorbose 1-phosphate reductase